MGINFFANTRLSLIIWETAIFYSAELKLVIEIDGRIHEKQKEYDAFRTFIINQFGVRVIRITNEEVKDIRTLMKELNILIPLSTERPKDNTSK